MFKLLVVAVIGIAAWHFSFDIADVFPTERNTEIRRAQIEARRRFHYLYRQMETARGREFSDHL